MKLIKQIEEERKDYIKIYKHAKDDYMKERCLGVIAALDWVRRSRTEEEPVDFGGTLFTLR